MFGHFRRTLRYRLAVWNALVVILTAALSLLALRQGVEWTLLSELDQVLAEDMEEVKLSLGELPRDTMGEIQGELARKAQGHRQHGWFVRLLTRDHAVVWSSLGESTAEIPVSPDPHPLPVTIGQLRLVQHDLDRPKNMIGAIQVGATLSFIRKDMARLDMLMMLVSGGMLIAAPGLGYWLAGRTTRTIGDIIHTAARLRPNRLEERLPVQGTGDELDQLAITVNGLLDRIGDYLRQNRDELANAAHELRSPLAAIRSSAEVTLGMKRRPEEYEEVLLQIIDQGTALETLVTQLLRISESEAERLKTVDGAVRLDEIVQRSTEMFAGVAESRDLALTCEASEPIVVRGNRMLLSQLVNNLIDNAIKYSLPGGTITVSLSSNRETRTALLTVTDQGIGIDPEDLPRIFDRFFRGDRSRQRLGETIGTGLGLSLCQAVATGLGGTIECYPNDGGGTCFRVSLPLAQA